MQTLILLGNGFDLAHGMQTSYFQFLKNSWEQHVEKPDLYTKLYKVNSKKNKSFEDFKKSPYFLSLKRNGFLVHMLKDINRKGWCDIEQLYFDLLIHKDTKHKQLNENFEKVKLTLEEYLFELNESSKPILHYKEFFNSIEGRKAVLNFNFTNTWKHYFDSKIVHNIHGQINDKVNPIVFGYAATKEQTKDLVERNDNEYLKNIKEYHYNNFGSWDDLLDFLRRDQTRVYLFGHSCGISDQLILSEIFDHESVDEIYIFYYKDRADYSDKQANISRVMNSDWRKKIQRFDKSSHMPQHNDSHGFADKLEHL